MNKLYSVLLAACMLVSCTPLDEMNIDPNRPTETHPQLQLTKIQWDAFRAYQGTGPLYALKMLVQTDGENANQYYKWNRSGFEAYAVLRDITKMSEEAARIGNTSYEALAKFFRAYYFYNLTLTFGDIPYAQALKGEAEEGIYAPAYDPQKAVFQGILAELAEADALLAQSNTIIDGDIIYGSNAEKWRKLVNAFRLKVLMTLSGKESDAELNVKGTFERIVAENPLFEASGGNLLADDAQLVFLNQEGNRYPEFNSSGYGSGMYIDSTFIRRLQDREDPRLFVYCTQTRVGKEAGKTLDDFTAYEGGDPAAPYAQVNLKAAAGRTSKVLERYHQDPTNEPFVLMGYAEQQFILAEAVVRGWISGDAGAYYESGIRASFKFYETYAKGLGSYVDETAVSAYLRHSLVDFALAQGQEGQLERIVTQKYLRSFLQGGWSAFYDHLRTGYPEFRRPRGVAVPFRWMYPQSEYNYNGEHVSAAIASQFGAGNDDIHEKPWWLK